MTVPQRETIAAVTISHRAGRWHRAEHKGQRVTLANLARKGVLERRVWRGTEGHPDAAHEYKLGHVFRVTLGLQVLE